MTPVSSTIGRGTVVRGNLNGDGDLEILGRVEGSVAVTGELSIAESALIKSDVRGRRVIVRGAVAGNVSATEAIVLEPGARVVGDLGAPQIGIRPGALLRGMVSTGAPPAAPIATAATARAPRAATPTPAPARAAAPARAPARPAPVAAKPAPPPPPPPRVEPEEEEEETQTHAHREEPVHAAERGGPPPPVVPQIKKGAKASLKRKSTR